MDVLVLENFLLHRSEQPKQDELKRKQVEELINVHFIRKKVPVSFLIFGKAEMASGNTIRQLIEIKNGISREDSQKIIKKIKTTKSIFGPVIYRCKNLFSISTA